MINNTHLSIAGDGTPVVTSARERKRRVCKCAEKGILDCDCERYFSQPDCDVGWDSSRNCFYHGYDLYMMVASDSRKRPAGIPIAASCLNARFPQFYPCLLPHEKFSA